MSRRAWAPAANQRQRVDGAPATRRQPTRVAERPVILRTKPARRRILPRSDGPSAPLVAERRRRAVPRKPSQQGDKHMPSRMPRRDHFRRHRRPVLLYRSAADRRRRAAARQVRPPRRGRPARQGAVHREGRRYRQPPRAAARRRGRDQDPRQRLRPGHRVRAVLRARREGLRTRSTSSTTPSTRSRRSSSTWCGRGCRRSSSTTSSRRRTRSPAPSRPNCRR